MRKLSLIEFRRLREKENMTVVDVRPRSEHELGHIPDSACIPLDEVDIEKNVEVVAGGRQKPVILYCSGPSCDLSVKAALDLEEDGFSDILVFEGGLAEWKRSGQKVQTAHA